MIRFLRYVDLMLIGILYASHRISQSSEARVPSSFLFNAMRSIINAMRSISIYVVRREFFSFFLFYFLSFSTYAYKVGILCRSDLRNETSENSGWNVSWKYQDWTTTTSFKIFIDTFRSFTKSPTKSRIWMCFNIRDN